MPVIKGSGTILPSPDTRTPPVPIGASMLEIAVKHALSEAAAEGRVYLMPEDFDIPRRKCYTPSELAPHFYVCPKTINRMIEDELFLALPMRDGGEPKIPYIGVVYFFLKQQGALN